MVVFRVDCVFVVRVDVLLRVETALRLDVLLRSTVVAVRCAEELVIVLTVVRAVPLLFTRVSTEVDGVDTLAAVEDVRLLVLTAVVSDVVCVGRVAAGRVVVD